jgi:DNA-binding transcriptional MerR regulator
LFISENRGKAHEQTAPAKTNSIAFVCKSQLATLSWGGGIPKQNSYFMFETYRIQPDLPPSELIYTSTEVSRIAQISLRQLQWWDERQVVSPRQENHQRLYSTDQVIEIAIIAELRRKGVSLQKIRHVLRLLPREMSRRFADSRAEGSKLHLLTDGCSLYLEEHQDRIIDRLTQARQPMFLVCVSDQVLRCASRKLRCS